MKKRKSKIFLSLVFAALISISSVCLPVAFAQTTQDKDTPVILVPGYASAPLFVNYGTDAQRKVWQMDFDSVISLVLNNFAKLGISLGALTLGNTEMFVDRIGSGAMDIVGEMACNPDGSSKYDITVDDTTPQSSSYAAMMADVENSQIIEKEIMAGFAEIIDPNRLFTFNTDFRKGAVECAEDLRVYVEQVKEYTNSDKVSMYGISHGGQIVGAYLSLYGEEGDLVNVVMNVPALGGASLASDSLGGDVHIDEKLIAYYVERGLVSETNLNWLLSAQRFGILDKAANELIERYFFNIFGYWGSMWDLIPMDYYEAIKAKLLDSEDSAELIRKSDYMHYQIMPNYAEAFKRAQAAGARVSIMSSTGAKAVTGLNANTDAIIPVKCSSGALCAPYGKRFSDGYKCTGTVCTDPTHHHLSPSMEIDATYCWLPENTWFIDGQFHGMSYWDIYSRLLVRKLVFANEEIDIYSDPEYPQFGRTHNATDELYIEFDVSTQGFVNGEDSKLTVTNLSEKYSVKLLKVYCDGMDISFKTRGVKIIPPGGSAELEIIGEVPDVSNARAYITVNFIQLGSISWLSSKTFDYTILGGTPVTYDSKTPYSDVDIVPVYACPFMRFLDGVLSSFYLNDILRIVYTTFISK